WNGAKRDITIEENWVHDIAGCCGIELQDGTAAGAWLIGNVVENTGDSGMAAIQLTSGSPTGRANIIRDNQVRNPGRFGIEIKIPFGNGRLPGAGSTDDGVILVENNEVDGGGAQSLRDRAGIAVIRNGYAASVPGEIDIAQGVVVRNNTVRQFRTRSPDFEGYGIVIEGAGSRAYDNVLEDNDIGLQYQEGNTGDQNTAGSPWFGRGSAVETCVAPGANTFLGNSEDERVVPTGADLVGGVFNTG